LTHGLEGIDFSVCTLSGYNGVSHTSNIWLNTGAQNQRALQFNFDSVNMECTGVFYNINSVEDVKIVNSSFLVDTDNANPNIPSGYTTNTNILNFKNCIDGLIEGNTINIFPWFTLTQTVGKNYIFYYQSGQQGNQTFRSCNNVWTASSALSGAYPTQAGGIYCAADSADIRDINTQFTERNNPPDTIIFTKATGAVNCYSTAYVEPYQNSNASVTCAENGVVILSGYFVATINSSGVATITLPTGLFSSVGNFVQIQLFNTIFSSTDYTVTSVTTSAITLLFSPAHSGSSVPLTYQITGNA
jgi:hypothetical protein